MRALTGEQIALLKTLFSDWREYSADLIVKGPFVGCGTPSIESEANYLSSEENAICDTLIGRKLIEEIPYQCETYCPPNCSGHREVNPVRLAALALRVAILPEKLNV